MIDDSKTVPHREADVEARMERWGGNQCRGSKKSKNSRRPLPHPAAEPVLYCVSCSQQGKSGEEGRSDCSSVMDGGCFVLVISRVHKGGGIIASALISLVWRNSPCIFAFPIFPVGFALCLLFLGGRPSSPPSSSDSHMQARRWRFCV